MGIPLFPNLALTLAILLTALAAFAADPTPVAPAPAQIDAVFKDLDRPDSPGCALAVIRDGQIAYQRGYGMASLELGVAITPETVFDIGSTEKQFAATSILLLEQEGKLSLDDDIRKYLPEIPDYGGRIAIHHLLHHTSGLRDYIGLLELAGHREEDVTTDEDALDLIARQKGLDFPAGTEHSYSNTGYFLLSQIVRRVSGKTLREFAGERILMPLGMTSSLYLDDHTMIVPRRAASYAKRPSGGFRLESSNWEQTGDGGLQTTVLDLAKWDDNFYRPVVGGEKLIEKLQTPGTLSNGEKLTYALGLRVDSYRGLRRVSHGGSWAGFRAQLLRFPHQRFSAIVLCNLATAGPGELATKVAELYLAGDMKGEAPPRADVARKISLPSADLERYGGLYWDTQTDDVGRITAREGHLFFSRDGETQRELIPAGEDRFRMKDGVGVEIVFPAETARSKSIQIVYPEEKPSVYQVVSPVSPSAAELAAYTGKYASEELDTRYEIFLEKDRLRLRRRGANLSALKPLFADAFSEEDVGLLRFSRDRTGRVTGFDVRADRSKMRFERQS